MAVVQCNNTTLLGIPVKEFIFSKIAGLQPATLKNNELLCRYFSRFLTKSVQNLLCKTPLSGYFHHLH